MNKNAMESTKIEGMASFFDSRIEDYDDIHRQTGISWGMQIRDIISNYISPSESRILDLGCGTGLELEGVFKKSPNSSIVCIDISIEMLKKLREKFVNRDIEIINDNFFNVDFGNKEYDYVISVMALHHFFEDEKMILYKKIYDSLKDGGLFINSDYIINDQAYEQQRFQELRAYQEANPGQLVHFDIPFTEEREKRVLTSSGFSKIDNVYENKKTKVYVCHK